MNSVAGLVAAMEACVASVAELVAPMKEYVAPTAMLVVSVVLRRAAAELTVSVDHRFNCQCIDEMMAMESV